MRSTACCSTCWPQSEEKILKIAASDRRRGISKAMAEGKFKGRPENTERNSDIADMLADGKSWNTIQRVTNCSRATIAKVAAKRPSAERALA
ncbi:DNA invertase Pin-like site-specific DNA recombinase [Bradyrhizobium sp. LM3.2]